MSDIDPFSLPVLANWSNRSRNCLSPQKQGPRKIERLFGASEEFCGCSARSLHRQKSDRPSKCLLSQLPFPGLPEIYSDRQFALLISPYLVTVRRGDELFQEVGIRRMARLLEDDMAKNGKAEK